MFVHLQGVVGACVAEFEKLLSESGRSVGLSNEGMMQIIHPLTPEAARDIKALCDMFGESPKLLYRLYSHSSLFILPAFCLFAEANRNTAHFKVYQTVRVAKLKAELKQQETSCAAQWAAAQQDGPYEKGSHPFKDYFLLAYWLLRSELQLWGSTLPSNEESLQVFVGVCEALIAEVARVLHPILAEDSGNKTSKANPVVKKVRASFTLLSFFCLQSGY